MSMSGYSCPLASYHMPIYIYIYIYIYIKYRKFKSGAESPGLLQIVPSSPFLESSFFDFPDTEAGKYGTGLRLDVDFWHGQLATS